MTDTTRPASIEGEGEGGRFSPEFRRTHLGASQIPAAIGVSPYEAPVTLWQRYKGLLPWDNIDPDDEDAHEAIDIGHAVEDGVGRLAARRLGMEIRRAPMQVHPRIPWLVSSRDFEVFDIDRWVPLECKGAGLARPLYREARDRWGPSGTAEAPTHYVAQLMTQVLVDRACVDEKPPTHGYIAALLGGAGLYIYRVPYVDDIARSIVSQANEFWQRVIDPTMGPPPPDGTDAYTRYLNERLANITHPRQQRWIESEAADEIGAEVMAAYVRRKEAEEAYELAKQRAMTIIGEGDGLRGPWGSVPLGYRAGKKSLHQGALREKLVRTMFADLLATDPHTANVKASEFIESCFREGDPHTVFGPPRAPPKNPPRKKR